MGAISTDPGYNLQPCPKCGGSKYSQTSDMLARNRVRCDGCGIEYDRRALWLARSEDRLA